jgi:DNA-directed RNA polymerase subunit alpha
MELSNFDISVRAWTCLKSAGINTVNDLCNLTKDDIIKIRNLGRKSLEEILKLMKDNGWKFKTE